MSEIEVNNLLLNAHYKVAKSMPKIPHSYTLRYTWQDQSRFEQVVQYIRDNGKIERFYSKTYIYYYLNGYKYWTMGSAIHKTILINRAKA